MHSWQSGTRYRDDVNVLWCHSYLVWLVFEGSSPTCACFHSENFIVTCSCFLFLVAMSESLEVCQFSSTEAISTHCYNVSASN